MNTAPFEIGATGVDAEAIVARIRAAVEAKIQRGVYTDVRVARAERTNLANLRDEESYLKFYLEALREAVYVDIGDFEIVERRTVFSGMFISLKRLIWNALRFYTYRLWSQQNQTNGLLFGAVENIENVYRAKVADLEERISKLETAARRD